MFEILYQTLVRLCEEHGTYGTRPIELQRALRADGLNMNRDAFAAIMYEWMRYEWTNGKRVEFMGATSSRDKDCLWFHHYNERPFVCGALAVTALRDTTERHR